MFKNFFYGVAIGLLVSLFITQLNAKMLNMQTIETYPVLFRPNPKIFITFELSFV
ncbi:MAG: hypothetical protein LBT04_01710 [Prevotellaceae bacterium]|nr:hypothetical protein [Prevotellaceae bacterium]